MRNVEWFEQIGIDDVPHVGGKNASLGEMYQELDGKGVKVPNGFATTAEAFREFLRVNDLEAEIATHRRRLGPLATSTISPPARGRSAR